MQDFNEFKQKYPDIARILENPETQLTEEWIQKANEKDAWIKKAKAILSGAQKTKQSVIFHQPVDIKKYNIPDYYDVIKRPMDFSTIKTKLNSNVYSDMDEFINDLLLVFWNCDRYNGE